MAHKKPFSTVALLLFALLGQACGSGPIREDWVFGRGALKRQEQKWSISDRERIQYEKTDVFVEHQSM